MPRHKPSDVLTKALAILEDGRCRCYYATNADGTPLDATSKAPWLDPAAVRFCVSAAIKRALDQKKLVTKNEAKCCLLVCRANKLPVIGRDPIGTVVRWGDSKKSDKTVFNGFRKAIKLAESEGL